MSLSFPSLIILLLPGFLSLWVYQGFTYEELHKKGDWHYGSLGLMFGVADLGLHSLLMQLIKRGLESCGLPFNPVFDLDAGIVMDVSFWFKYALLIVVALAVGFCFGFLARKTGYSVIGWLRRLGAKKLNVPERTTAESALDYAISEKRHAPGVAALLICILDKIDGPYKLIGFYGFNSFDPRELELSRTHLFSGLESEDAEFEFIKTRPSDAVILDSGLIVEIKPLTQEQYDDLVETLEKRYKMRNTFNAS